MVRIFVNLSRGRSVRLRYIHTDMVTNVWEYFLKYIMLTEIKCLYSLIYNKVSSKKFEDISIKRKRRLHSLDLQEKEEKGKNLRTMWTKAKS